MNFKNVQWLTIRELSELWAPALKIPASAIEREIRIALYKLEIDYPFNDNINFKPDEQKLPSPGALNRRIKLVDGR